MKWVRGVPRASSQGDTKLELFGRSHDTTLKTSTGKLRVVLKPDRLKDKKIRQAAHTTDWLYVDLVINH